MDFTDSRPPMSARDLAAKESALGCRLPAPYWAFLLDHNGGQPVFNVFPIADCTADDHGLIDRMLCIRPGDPYDLATWSARYRDRIPAGTIPIGCDPGGILLCLAVDGKGYGSVIFLDHEEESDEGHPPTRSNGYLVARSFRMVLPAELLQTPSAHAARTWLEQHFAAFTVVSFRQPVFADLQQQVVLAERSSPTPGIRAVELDSVAQLPRADSAWPGTGAFRPLDGHAG